MREDVCIALNEREPLKHQMARELEEQLSLRNISCSRIELTSNLAKVVLERLPRVLVLDFILGDVATALDVLTELQPVISKQSVKALMWTDEQSVQVVVTAMKLGASDFIRLDEAKSLQKILYSIEECLQQTDKKEKEHSLLLSKIRYQEPIGESQVFQDCTIHCHSIATRCDNAVILSGQAGSGRNTLAHYIHHKRTNPGAFISIDFDTFQNDASCIVGSNDVSSSVPYLSHAATVFIDHVEFDTGELLKLVEERQRQIWSANRDYKTPMLIIGTTCEETAKCWRRLLDIDIVNIPSLKDRKTDFLELFQHFSSIVSNFSKKPLKSQQISPAYITAMSELDWPGNIRQLKASIIEAVSTPITSAKSHFDNPINNEAQDNELTDNTLIDDITIEDIHSNELMQKMTPYERNLFRALLSAKERWAHYRLVKPYLPSPIIAREALDSSNGNYRMAAARLGTGISQIKSVLQNYTNSQQFKGQA